MTVLGVGIETAILTDCHCYHDDVGEPVIMVSGDYYTTVCNIVSEYISLILLKDKINLTHAYYDIKGFSQIFILFTSCRSVSNLFIFYE